MKGATILKVWDVPNSFPLIGTDQGWFEMRMGGIARKNVPEQLLGSELEVSFLGSVIGTILSDDHWVYLITSRQEVISFGWGEVDPDGSLSPVFHHEIGTQAATLLAELELDPTMLVIEPFTPSE